MDSLILFHMKSLILLGNCFGYFGYHPGSPEENNSVLGRFFWVLGLFFGTMGSLSNFLDSKSDILFFQFLQFFDSILRGCGQVSIFLPLLFRFIGFNHVTFQKVLFLNNPITGLIIIVALFLSSTWLATASLLGLFCSTIWSYLLGM